MFENSNLPKPTSTYDKFYRDISLTSPSFLENEEDVIQQYIQTLLQTKRDSIEFEEFGINLEEFLFQIPSQLYCNIIFERVVRGIKEFMPSVKIDFTESKVYINEKNDREYILVLVVITKGGKNITIKQNLGMDIGAS